MVFTAKWIRHPEDKQFYIIWLSVLSSSILIWTESRPLPIPGEAFDGSFVLTLHLELFWSSQHRPTAVTNAQQNYQHLPHTSNMAFLLRGTAYMSERQRQDYYRTVTFIVFYCWHEMKLLQSLGPLKPHPLLNATPTSEQINQNLMNRTKSRPTFFFFDNPLHSDVHNATLKSYYFCNTICCHKWCRNWQDHAKMTRQALHNK